jgi:hypothetical protein
MEGYWKVGAVAGRPERHKSYLTTQRYIYMADQLPTAVSVLHVPAEGAGLEAE